MDEWLLLDQTGAPGDPFGNMALDEALLLHAARRGAPTLRFYAWDRPAASFGLLQAYAAAAALTPLRPLVRRPTGGGLVLHENDWTYSLIFPPNRPWSRLRAEASYRRLHEWLRKAFSLAGVETRLAQAPQIEGPGQCFVGAERHDLLCSGRKIAGAAQRRARHGLLIQGSVQPPPGLDRASWQRALRRAAEVKWGVRWVFRDLDEAELETARRLREEKYAAPSFLKKR
ncbi:MAG: hypothetical protein J7M29_07500 [Verrucomicrobia bacterium]|nr:hypothetical protein [Verrucomicrobiota bacterium]